MFSLALEEYTGFVDVATFAGREVVGRPARVDVEVLLDADPSEVEATFLGRRAVLHIDTRQPLARRIAGVISNVRWAGTTSHGAQRFRFRIVSRLARLALTRRSRIFQDLSADAILFETLSFHEVRHRFALRHALTSRDYCVQYRETDLEFMSRLLAEEGLFFFLEDPAPGSFEATVVITDDVHAYPRIPGPALVFREPSLGMVVQENHMRLVAHEGTAGHERVRLTSYDASRPSIRIASDAHEAKKPLGSLADGLYCDHDEDLSPGGPAQPSTLPWPRANIVLEQLSQKRSIAQGETSCVRLYPGGVIDLCDHDVSAFDGSYVMRKIVHRGVDPRAAGAQEPYTAKFEAVPSTRRLRPKPPRRRLAQVAETARVVGPYGAQEGEVHTDRLGRVEVEFPWAKENESSTSRSSCWIRTVQSWSGAGFGTQFIPRVGMEVLVVFLGGDPDRPIVVGTLPNAEHLPPFDLPAAAATSGIRTQSVGGSGSNELSFIDTSGREAIRLKSQKDLDVVAEDTLTIFSGNVRNDFVGGEHITVVSGDDRSTFERDRAAEIFGSDKVNVYGNAQLSSHERLSIHGSHAIDIDTQGAVFTHADGAVVVDAGTDVSIRSGPGNGVLQLSSGGSLFAQSCRDLTIQAADRITLAVGSTRLEITEEGLKLKGNDITLEAIERLFAKGKGPSVELGDRAAIVGKEIMLISESAEVTLTKDAEIKGTQIKLGGQKRDAKQESTSDEIEKRPFRIKVTDYDIEPYADKHYELIAQGMRIEGTTSIDGVVEAELPADTKVVDLKVWIDLYPEGRTRQWLVEIVELADIGSPRGVLERLKNLGYYGGPYQDELGAGGAAALVWFQNDYGLKPTGALDSLTKQKLLEVHGD